MKGFCWRSSKIKSKDSAELTKRWRRLAVVDVGRRSCGCNLILDGGRSRGDGGAFATKGDYK